MNNTAIAVAWTGASGIQYGIRLLEELLKADRQVYLLYSQAAQIVAQMETGLVLPSRAYEAQRMLCERYGVSGGQLQVFGRQQWTAPPASGSNPPEAVVPLLEASRGRAFLLFTSHRSLRRAAGLLDGLQHLVRQMQSAQQAMTRRSVSTCSPWQLRPYSLVPLCWMVRVPR